MSARNNPRLVTALFAAATLLMLPVGQVFAQAAVPTVVFDPSVVTAKPGEEVTVDIKVGNGTTVNLVELEIVADANIELRGLNEMQGYIAAGKLVTASKITSDIAKVGGTNFTQDEVIAQLTFKAGSKEVVARINTTEMTKVGDTAVTQSFLEVTIGSVSSTEEGKSTATTAATGSETDLIARFNALDDTTKLLAGGGVVVLVVMLVLLFKLMRNSKQTQTQF